LGKILLLQAESRKERLENADFLPIESNGLILTFLFYGLLVPFSLRIRGLSVVIDLNDL